MQRILALSEDNTLFPGIEEATRQLPDPFRIHLFQHSLELVNYSLSHYAALVILDIDLLREETLHMIQILHSIHTDAKILLILSPEYMPVCSSALSLGIVSYQVKPILIESAVKIISSLLRSTVSTS